MAVIYDLSQLTFEMSVDELDVRSVQVGQKVQVTADAVEVRPLPELSPISAWKAPSPTGLQIIQ